MAKTTSKPIVMSINVCDEIIRDEISKKISLIGLFSQIQTATFPAHHPSLHVYVSLTDGHGNYAGELRFVSEEDNSIIASMKGKVPFQNPLQTVELNFAINNLKFEKPGKYRVEFFCDDEPVGSRQFIVSGPSSDTQGAPETP